MALDVAVHNTLWIVGHFHHMAMLNIGLLIFGAIYALLPELTGKALYSERMAWWHVGTTFVAGMTVFGLWLVQGLDGAPRRFAVLPGEYDGLTRVSLPFVFALAAAQLLFFVNVWQTLRGKAGAATFDEAGIPIGVQSARSWTVPVAEGWAMMAALGVALAFGVGGYFVGKEVGDGNGPSTVTAPAESDGVVVAGQPEEGTIVFASAGCGNCHTFAPAGSSGSIGPDLGTTALSEEQIRTLVADGRAAMPAFGGRLDETAIADVAAFVARPGG